MSCFLAFVQRLSVARPLHSLCFMRPVVKTSATDAGPESEPALRVVKSRKRRPATPTKVVSEGSSGSLKPILIGVGVGSAVAMVATAAMYASSGTRAAKSQPSLLSAIGKTAALAVASMVAKRLGRDLAERALPALAGRAIVALSARGLHWASVDSSASAK